MTDKDLITKKLKSVKKDLELTKISPSLNVTKTYLLNFQDLVRLGKRVVTHSLYPSFYRDES